MEETISEVAKEYYDNVYYYARNELRFGNISLTYLEAILIYTAMDLGVKYGVTMDMIEFSNIVGHNVKFSEMSKYDKILDIYAFGLSEMFKAYEEEKKEYFSKLVIDYVMCIFHLTVHISKISTMELKIDEINACIKKSLPSIFKTFGMDWVRFYKK